MQATLPHTAPVFSVRSTVDYDYHHHRRRYQQQRQAKVLKLRRQLVRQRYLFRQRLNQALSPSLRDKLNIRIILDTRYLQRPDFVGVFEACGQQWMIGFQARSFGGTWYFRASGSPTLYSCSFRHLETQLCYALGNCCVDCFTFA